MFLSTKMHVSKRMHENVPCMLQLIYSMCERSRARLKRLTNDKIKYINALDMIQMHALKNKDTVAKYLKIEWFFLKHLEIELDQKIV
jgi:hypothetical protein